VIKNLRLRWMWKAVEKLDDQYFSRQTISDEVDFYPNIAYIQDHHPLHTLDVSRPKKDSTILPLIIHIHGGGWVYGTKDTVYRLYGDALASKGFVVATINYRSAFEVALKDQISDVFAAIEAMVLQSEQFMSCPKRIFLVGDSAGAHLAACVALINRDLHLQELLNIKGNYSIQALGLSCGVFNFDTFIQNVKFPQKKATLALLFKTKSFKNHILYSSLSIVSNMNHQFPPCFVVASEMDALVNQSLEFIQCLQQHNILHQSLIFSKRHFLPHVFNVRLTYKESHQVLESMTDFFKSIPKSV